MIALPAATAEDAAAPLLVEVQPDPVGESFDEEWVEFANPTASDLSLDGLYLTDYDACFVDGEGFVSEYRWPLDVTVPAADRLVVELPSNCVNLANGGDTLALEGEHGNVIQTVSYGDEGTLDAPDDGESVSACHAGALVHGGWAIAAQSPSAHNQGCLAG